MKKQSNAYIHLLVAAFLIVAFSSCFNQGKNCFSVEGNYTWILPATLSPALDTFHVGDTIYISSEFSDDVFEQRSETFVKLENFKSIQRCIIIISSYY